MNAPTGYTALDLVGFTDKGTYNPSTDYVQNDITHYGGDMWLCLVDDTQGVTPAEGANWTLWIGEPTNLTEAIIAPLEMSPATAAHSVGDQLIYNDVLYKVIAAIAVNDVLTVGTNIEAARKIVYQISGIESDIATIEPTSTASKNYAVGEYMFYDWEFYRVITVITAGDTIVTTGAGQNVTEVTVGGELASLNSNLATKANQADVATIENGSTASKAYYVGDFVYRNGTLYKVTQNISIGGTFTVDTNIVTATIGENIRAEDVNFTLGTRVSQGDYGKTRVIRRGDSMIAIISLKYSSDISSKTTVTAATLSDATLAPKYDAIAPCYYEGAYLGTVLARTNGSITLSLGENGNYTSGKHIYGEVSWYINR